MINQSLLIRIQTPDVFEAFINKGVRDMSYVADWKTELGSPEYCSSKAYQAYLAEYSAAMVGSVVDKNAEKPTHQLPAANEIIGSLARISDEWQLDNDKLSQFYYMENRYRDNLKSGFMKSTPADRQALVDYLFNMFQNAVIAPHKRIDMMYYEGLYNGTQTVSATNNPKSKVTFSATLPVTTLKATTATWGNASATPIADLLAACDEAGRHGRSVLKIRMSRNTFRKMCKATEIAGKFELKFNKANATASIIPVDVINTYLESVMLPPIVVEDPKYVTFADGTSTNMIPDDRVVLQCTPRVAVLKISDPLESIDAIPNKTYANYEGNLVGFWRNDKGRFVDYEMWAIPVFNGVNNYFILKTDETV
jgi:hypothetical protein